MSSVLFHELRELEGLHGQNLETGAGIGSNMSYLDQYTNKVFGAPFQLLDSVDRRFSSINSELGNEYLRNIMLNSPILHIKPGLPKYTGRDRNLLDKLKQGYMDVSSGNMSFTKSLLGGLAESTIFGKGAQLQRRMFTIREEYFQYMQHVNYMCRSMATFLGLTTNTKFPTSVATASGMQEFKTMKWENYRMLSKTRVLSPSEQFNNIAGATLLGAFGSHVGSSISLAGKSAADIGKALSKMIINKDDTSDVLSKLGVDIRGNASTYNSTVRKSYTDASKNTVFDKMVDKATTVQFMVEPVKFEERLSNEVANSMIESKVGALNELGSEIAFITGSNVDAGLIEGMTEFLGNGAQSIAMSLAGIVEPITGGFASNLFTGAIRSLKGQKMIYPKIYKSSESTMDYQFTVNLNTPYGDVYNYYIQEIVPLCHLISLAAPRMVTANSTTSPYLVQAYIPGMCTCQMGMITDMSIEKNTSGKNVSVHGFPLDIKVSFRITELYNAMSISPLNDPASFLFNETLNDYMSNMAGLIPSVDTHTQQRRASFDSLERYFKDFEFKNDFDDRFLHQVEDFINPF